MKRLFFIGFFVTISWAQYSPYQGSYYFTLDFAPGIFTGDIKTQEDNEKRLYNLHLSENGEWKDYTYDYKTVNVRANIGWFFREKTMLGVNFEHNTIYQSISGTKYEESLLTQAEIGFITGYMLLDISRLQVFPNISANYSIGAIYRMASLKGGSFNNDEITTHVEEMNNRRITNGFSVDLGLRVMIFPFSGRFFGYFCPKIEYFFLHYKKDPSSSYLNNLNLTTYTLQLGFGYITE